MEPKKTGYCVRCRKKDMEMVETKETTMKNKRKALKGKCAKCGTGMCKILPKPK